jgi:hypothetical protein
VEPEELDFDSVGAAESVLHSLVSEQKMEHS